MKFTYEKSEVLNFKILSTKEVPALINHSLMQQFANNILNNIEYVLIQSLSINDKTTNDHILTLTIAYKYLISNIKSANSKLVEEIISDSFERFRIDYLELVKNHFVSKREFELNFDYDSFTKEFNQLVSSLQN